MFAADISFNELPEIGFAHHFFTEHYAQNYGYKNDDSFEIVYIKSGKIAAELYGERFFIDEGSIFILFRALPLRLLPANGTEQSHCSIQLSVKHSFRLVSDSDKTEPSPKGILLPFVTPPSTETEKIKRGMYSIVSLLGTSREENCLSASLAAAGILHRISSMYCERRRDSAPAQSVLSYKIKRYISEHISESIHLSDIGSCIGKTPNYLNAVFKAENGMSINKYINSERVRFLSELMSNKKFSFPKACINAGISDISYGYRLFKQYTGMTPKDYISSPRTENLKPLR